MDWSHLEEPGGGSSAHSDTGTSAARAAQSGPIQPMANDIILGRGVLHASHPGNIRFYAVIDEHLPEYNAATTRTKKTRIVQRIYDILTSLGRFVKEHPPSSACVVIDADTAKKKISHAIRYRRKPNRAWGRAQGRLESSSVRSNSSLNNQSSRVQLPPMQLPQATTQFRNPLTMASREQIPQFAQSFLPAEHPFLPIPQQQQQQQQQHQHFQQHYPPHMVPMMQQLPQGRHAVAVSLSSSTTNAEQRQGSSPESLFSDGELSSVLLPPEDTEGADFP